jgi:hypothetical protein
MCVENGPSLPLAGDLCRAAELQGIFAFFNVRKPVLLGVFCNFCTVDMESNNY